MQSQLRMEVIKTSFVYALLILFSSLAEDEAFVYSYDEYGRTADHLSETVRVQTVQGIVEGLYKTSSRNNTYASFKGIPFATPPLGHLRFKDPLPAEPWTGILDATKQKVRCVQVSLQRTIGNEDCLYLNVYTPNLELDKSLAVIVYVHGGAFVGGGTDMGVEALVDENVIVVAIAYRLGIFGFLSLNTADVPGNAAMKDQIMALRWVQQNIKNFGGDPDNVSIFGASAGAASVSLLQVSPMGKGLFHKVIAASGTCLCEWSVQRYPEKVVQKLADVLQLDSTRKDDFTKDLRNIPAFTLLEASNDVKADAGDLYEDLQFTPVVETIFDGVEPFLDEIPLDYLRNGKFADVPLMLGYTSKEYASFYESTTISSIINDGLTIIPYQYRQKASIAEIQKINYIIKSHFFGNEIFDMSNREHIFNAMDLIGDVMFRNCISYTAKQFERYSRSNVYYYRFSHRGELSHEVIESEKVQGAAHYDDQIITFYGSNPELFDPLSSDGWVGRRLAALYVNFAVKGNPTPGPPNQLLPVIWDPITPNEVNYLEINGDLTPSKDPDKHRSNFWNQLEEELGHE